jgi:hypothetical protein
MSKASRCSVTEVKFAAESIRFPGKVASIGVRRSTECGVDACRLDCKFFELCVTWTSVKLALILPKLGFQLRDIPLSSCATATLVITNAPGV